MATIPFRVAQRVSVKPTVAATTTTITLPYGATTGSTQILLFVAGSGQNVTAVPTGWTQRNSVTVQSGNISIYDKISASGTDNTVTVTHGSGIGTLYLIEALGVVGYQTSVSSNGSGPATTYATASITPDVSSGASWLIALAAQDSNNPVTFSGGLVTADDYYNPAPSPEYGGYGDAVTLSGAAVTVTVTPSGSTTGYETIFAAYKVNAPAKMSQLADSFATKDTSKWFYDANASVVSGQLNLGVNSSYNGYVSGNSRYDLTSDAFTIQVVQTPNIGSGSTELHVRQKVDNNNWVAFIISNGFIGAYKRIAGTTTSTSIAYNAATMKYLRIRHTGTQITWEYSADALTWTALGTPWTPTFAVTNLFTELMAGYWGTEASPGTAILDNVNGNEVVVDMTNATLAENASATALTVNVPIGVSANDLLLLAVTVGGGTAPASLSGWTTIATQTAGANAAGGLYYRIATATEPASYTLTGLTAAVQKVSASITRLSNVDPVSPLDTTAATNSPGSGSVTPPTVTVVKPGTAIVYMPIIDSASSSDWTMPSGVTRIIDSAGTGKRLVTAYETQYAAGASTARTFTQSGTTGLASGAITVAFRPASMPGTLTFINSVRTANSGVTDASIVVPSGVTTSHLGILTVEAANQGLAAMAVPSGWTMRGKNPGTGGSSGTLYVFTRLGGVKAGDTVTATLPSNTGATTTAAWYDTGGRDISLVSSVYDTATADVTTVTFPAPGHAGNRDVLLVAANRTTNANTLGTPAGVTLDFTGQEATWFGGAFFGHAANVASQVYTGTWAPSGATSHNVNAMQFVLASVSNPKSSTLTDTFASQDTTKWSWGAAAVDTGGQLVCTANSGYTGGITSALSYDLTGDAVYAQVAQAMTGTGTGTPETFLQLFDGVANSTNKNSLMWDMVGTNLIAYYRDAAGGSTTVATIAYSATTHAWWRIRTDVTGTTAYWDTSPDGLVWTQQASKAITIPVNAMKVILGTGYSGTFTPAKTAIFDNYNTVPPANPKLFDAATAPSGIYLGSTSVTALYMGSTKVWP